MHHKKTTKIQNTHNSTHKPPTGHPHPPLHHEIPRAQHSETIPTVSRTVPQTDQTTRSPADDYQSHPHPTKDYHSPDSTSTSALLHQTVPSLPYPSPD